MIACTTQHGNYKEWDDHGCHGVTTPNAQNRRLMPSHKRSVANECGMGKPKFLLNPFWRILEESLRHCFPQADLSLPSRHSRLIRTFLRRAEYLVQLLALALRFAGAIRLVHGPRRLLPERSHGGHQAIQPDSVSPSALSRSRRARVPCLLPPVWGSDDWPLP